MFFTKMSLRGKIASVIIALFLLSIIILIGKSIYGKITESVNTSAKIEEISSAETTENVENKQKIESQPSNQIIDNNENKIDEDKKEENETKEIKQTENKIDENKKLDNKTDENKKVDNNTDKKIETQETITREKTAAAEGKKGTIYLTFDDGPSTNITPKILDVLKAQNVKATFFILNYNSEGEKIVKRAYEEGHSIGIHGYSHKYEDIYKNDNTYMNNLNKLQEKIEKSIGIKVRITRFPGGSSNTITKKYNIGIMSRLVKKVEASGYKYYDWNIDSNDAGTAKTSAKVYSNVIKKLSKNRPNVVLMHDFANGQKTLNALNDIIKYAKANGYEFQKITYEGNLVSHHNVNN